VEVTDKDKCVLGAGLGWHPLARETQEHPGLQRRATYQNCEQKNDGINLVLNSAEVTDQSRLVHLEHQTPAQASRHSAKRQTEIWFGFMFFLGFVVVVAILRQDLAM
jgi:hypothetical protein